jgi:hypothetical protein
LAAVRAPRRPISSWVVATKKRWLHGLDEDGATDAVVPCLTEVVSGAVHDEERGVGDDGIAGLDAHGGGFGEGVGADVQEYVVAGDDGGDLGWGDDVDVADAGDGVHRAFAAEDDPALVGEGLVEPAAEHLHGELAVGADATDHAAQLVHVGVDHDAGARTSV